MSSPGAAHKGRGIGGKQAQRILVAIHAGNGRGGPATRHRIKLAVAGEVSDAQLGTILGDLHRRGFVSETRSGGHHAYLLTPLGAHQIPRQDPVALAANWTPLRRPPVPPRRAGSQAFRELPSVAAGREMGWRHPT
jgi:hypothetical protein